MDEAGDAVAAGLRIRPARMDDGPALDRLIAVSARTLSAGFYDDRQIDAAITHVFGVDSDLVADGTYLVVEEERRIVGCGGWSRRRTLFGGDNCVAREPGYLDPVADAARIRAFFVAPGHARKGIASRLLAACEAAAAAAGFSSVTLIATLPGVPFYRARGFRAGAAIEHRCGDVSVRFVPMIKGLLHK